MQFRHLMGVQENQQLHCPFNIRQSAAPKFGVGVTVRAARQPFVIHSGLHPSHFAHQLWGGTIGRVAERINRCEELQPHVLIASDVCGTQQRLNFPGLTPLFVVTNIRVDSAHHGTRTAFRAQAQIHLQRRITTGFGKPATHPVAHTNRPAHGLIVVHAWRGFAHKHHVRVGAVAQLSAAEAAHADYGDARRSFLHRSLCASFTPTLHRGAYLRSQSGLQHGIPHKGETAAHLLHIHHVE